MKYFRYLIFLFAPAVGFGQIAYDVRLLQVNAGGTAYTEVLLPGSASITDLATFRTFIGLGGLDNPAHSTLNLVGANSLALGTSSANQGSIGFKNSTNNNVLTLQSGATAASYTFALPTAVATANGAVFTGNTDGTTAFTVNPSISTLNVYGANSLALGTASTNAGSINFKNGTNANTITIVSGVTSTTYTMTLPTATAGGNNYLLNMDADGTMAFTDPASLTGAAPEGTAVLSTGEAGGTKFLREDGDGTSSWQTIGGGGDALVASPLSQFAATTSLQLKDTISDETGSGALVFATSPTLVTPEIGAATATSPAANDNDTSVATTAYVQGELTAYASDTVTFTNKTLTGAKHILTPSAMGALEIDVTNMANTKSISGPATMTFSSDTPTTGQVSRATIKNTAITDSLLTLSSATTIYSESYNGARTTVTIPASGQVTLGFEYDGAQFKMTGDPVDFFADIAEDLTPTDTSVDAFPYYDSATKAVKRMTLNNISALPIITAAGFNGNLAVTDDTLQEIAQKVDDLAAGGTVTSVGWTGGIVSVATGTTTPAFTIAGTSGGIPYFNSGTTWATSAALAANAIVIGGGAGAAPSTTTTAAGVLTFLGTPSSANLRSVVSDESGTGALIFAGGNIGAATATTPSAGDNDTSVATTAFVQTARLVAVNTKSGVYTIGTDSSAELLGGFITVTAAATMTGPATLVAGQSFTIKANTTGTVVFNPDNAHTITLDGTALAAGDSVSSTGTAGELVTFIATSTTTLDATSDGWTDTN